MPAKVRRLSRTVHLFPLFYVDPEEIGSSLLPQMVELVAFILQCMGDINYNIRPDIVQVRVIILVIHACGLYSESLNGEFAPPVYARLSLYFSLRVATPQGVPSLRAEARVCLSIHDSFLNFLEPRGLVVVVSRFGRLSRTSSIALLEHGLFCCHRFIVVAIESPVRLYYTLQGSN